ncbi:MAG: TonB-dependent receptor [Pseudomonadota bacterium]
MSSRLKRMLRRTTATVGLFAITFSSFAVAADDEQYRFDIVGQSLPDALRAFSRTAGVQVAADSDAIREVDANPVSGEMTADQAINRLVAGTGLQLVSVSDGSYALRAGSASAVSIEETLDATVSNPQVDEIIVRGARDAGYRVEDTTSASLFAMALDETPFNIGVITESLMDDLQIDDLKDAVLLNASVQRNHTHSKNAVGYTIRGFNLDADQLGYLVNGVPVSSFDAPPAHTSALDRIEIVKGSAALYYGAGEPAGIINYVYKRPLETAQYQAQVAVGDNSEYRAEIDATGPLLGNDRLLYRFTFGWEDSEGVVDFDRSKDIAPTAQLLWKASERTELGIIAEYIKHEGNPIISDTIFSGGDFIEGPKGQYLGFSSDYDEQDSTGVQLYLDHVFANDVKLKVQTGYKDGGREAGNSGYFFALPFPIPGFSDPANGVFLRSAFDQKREAESEYFASHLNWEMQTGDVSHEFTVGVNYSKSTLLNIGFFNSAAALSPADILAVLTGDPTPLQSLPPSVNLQNLETVDYEHFTNFYDSPPFNRARWQFDNFGLNLQDAIDIPSMNLHLLVGLRYGSFGNDAIEQVDNDGNIGPGNTAGFDESEWIPRVGAVYDFNDSHTVFVSYGESFRAPFGSAVDRNGDLITASESGNQWEVGYRGEFLNGKLSTTMAVYELTKEDVIVPTGIPDVSEVAGEQRSRGFELDVIGKFNDYWDIYFSYAYTDTENVDGGTTSATNGARFAGIPLHKAVMWNNFALDWVGLDGFSVGYGVDYSSEILSGVVDFATLSSTNTLIDGQGVVHNANITYQTDTAIGDLVLNLGIKNLTDRFYVLNNGLTLFAKRGEPRSVLLTANLLFR